MTFVDYIFENSKDCKGLPLPNIWDNDYKELYNGIVNLSSYISSKVGRGQTMFLISDNSLFYIESYFAIIKSGNVCVPLNPDISKKDLEYIISLCEPSLIFIKEKYVRRFEDTISKDICISEGFEFTQQEGSMYNNDVNAEDTAVIFFTSGTTGFPKGVMLTHNNLIANTESIIDYLELLENDRVEVVLPFYYCYGASLLHTHMRVGASLVINNKFMFMENVLDDIERYECTSFSGVPSHFQMLLRRSSFKNRNLKSLRYVTQAGGRLSETFIRELMDTLKHTKIFIMYGQTEASARLSYLPPKFLNEKIGSIGKGIKSVELKVINNDGKQVGLGEVGAVVAKGDNIMKGYLKDEKATREVLKNGWLYTGDLATVDEDGYIYLTSREKQIIKSGGYRISPKEIEDVIYEIPEVVENAVVPVQDDVLSEAVKAFVVLKQDSKVSKEYIIEHCKNKLQSYKVPRYVEFIKSIPKNSSGKLMIRELQK